MTRKDFASQEDWISHIHDFKVGDRVIVEAINFSGPLEVFIEKVCFKGNGNDSISIKNGFVRTLSIHYDILSIKKQG